MRKISFAVLGMGNRGYAYASKLLKYPEQALITAIADSRPVRLKTANQYLNLPQERLFDSSDAIFSVPKLADVMIISTQDNQHREHALRAMELGYDLLLEKPISNKLEEIALLPRLTEVCKAIMWLLQRKRVAFPVAG